MCFNSFLNNDIHVEGIKNISKEDIDNAKSLGYKIKLLVVKKDQKLSFQYHNRRSEQWIILRGTALIQLEDKLFEMKAKDHIIIPKKAKHRVENIGNDDLLILEANFGSYIEEDDIVRLEDIYNRVV